MAPAHSTGQGVRGKFTYGQFLPSAKKMAINVSAGHLVVLETQSMLGSVKKASGMVRSKTTDRRCGHDEVRLVKVIKQV